MIIKKELERVQRLANGNTKLVFSIQDDVHGGFQTDVHIDELHEALLPRGPGKQAALEAALRPIVESRIEKWLVKKAAEVPPEEAPAIEDLVTKSDFLG